MPSVEAIMTRDVVTIDLQMSLREALETLRAEDISGAPVRRGDRVVGVISATDILEFEASTPGVPVQRSDQSPWGELEAPEEWEVGSDSPSAFFVDFWSNVGADVTARLEEPDSPEWDLLEAHVVAEAATRNVVAVTPGTDVREAARVMLEAGVHRLLVLSDGELLGLVSQTDVVRAVAEGAV